MMPHILVDADACPVVRQVEEIASRHALPVMLLCDEHHIMRSDYSQVRYVSAGADAVDIALMNLCRRGDIVIRAHMPSITRESAIQMRILICC